MRRDEKPGLLRRLGESVMALGVVVLLGGLVCAFVVAGFFVIHAVLDRNRDPHADGPAAPLARAEARSDVPAAAFAAPAPVSIAEKPAVAVSAAGAPVPPPAPAPPPLPPKDPTRVDAEGFIRYWLVLAPLPSEREMAGAAEVLREQLPNEAALRPRAEERVSVKGKELAWKRFRTADFFVDFRKFVEGQRGDDVVAYAVCYVVSAEEMKDVKMFIGSNDQARVYLNGRRVLQVEKSRTLQKDQDVAAGLTLRKGQNVVVFKVVNEKNLWQGCLRFADRNGTPLTQIHVTSTPE